jgi:hypothetical protein
MSARIAAVFAVKFSCTQWSDERTAWSDQRNAWSFQSEP